MRPRAAVGLAAAAGCSLLFVSAPAPWCLGFVAPPSPHGSRGSPRPPLPATDSNGADNSSSPTPKIKDSNFVVAVLGDLHLPPLGKSQINDEMQPFYEARDSIKELVEMESFLHEVDENNKLLVSLGDLGAYGSAGTKECFSVAKAYLDGFDVPYELITGNHDLEDFSIETDEENLANWMESFGREQPQFCHQLGERTVCVGLSTVAFRDNPYSSHEVFIDNEQLAWFEDICRRHPAEEGWRILVFTHAPPMGSGLRVLQDVHLRNACAWINHTRGDESRRYFMRMCQKYSAIKLWFSGHFHLSHGPFSIGVRDDCECAFIQVGVIGPKSSRDQKRQSRLVTGSDGDIKVYSINHHEGGKELRLDLTLQFDEDGKSYPTIAHGNSQDYDRREWFSAFTPCAIDGCYLQTKDGIIAAAPHDEKAVCWWHMSDGRILGVHDSMVVEYDQDLLSPLGIVCDAKQLRGRDVVVAEGGQALMLVQWKVGADPEDVEVVHPQSDGSYWTPRQRNKILRNQEKEREQLAREWLASVKQDQ